jgi:dTDP-4-dehydrorhamnose reductase
MKVTIFGATGVLGKALMREWRGDPVTGLSSKDADIRDQHAVGNAVRSTRPDWIVLAAAYTDVDGCETNRELAFAVNRDGVANVARAAKQHNSKLLFLSTDYVFDGRKTSPYEPDDSRSPQSIYGRSKAEAETLLETILPDSCIARTSWLFGVGGRCFPDTILKLASTRGDIDVVDDQRGSPTYAIDLARAIIQLCRKQASGIVHVTNRGECTWFDFARAIVSAAELNTIIRPTTTEKFPRPAQRPKYSVLSPESLDRYDITMPDWDDALRRYVVERSFPA